MVKSEAKAEAVRENGKLGGRPPEAPCACGHQRSRHVGANCNACGWRGLRCKEWVHPCEALLPISRRHAAQGFYDIPCGRRAKAQVNGKHLCGIHLRPAHV